MTKSKIYQYYFGKGPFTFDELYRKYKSQNTKKTLRNLVYRGLKQGTLGMVRRGLYFVIPPDQTSRNYAPDPFLVIPKLSHDSVVGYHSALALHGAAYSDSNRIYFFTPTLTRGFEFQEIEYVPVQMGATWGTLSLPHAGRTVKTTDRERTVLDCVDRPNYAGGMEELMKSVELLPSVDLSKLESYLLKVKKKILFSKIGFVLEHMKSRWYVPEAFLTRLEKHCGKGVCYFETRPGRGQFIKRWRLIVPKQIKALLRGV